LHIAARDGHDSSVRFLLSFDASLHALDRNGETPLFKAVRSGNVSAVKDLLLKGADRSVKNKDE